MPQRITRRDLILASGAALLIGCSSTTNAAASRSDQPAGATGSRPATPPVPETALDAWLGDWVGKHQVHRAVVAVRRGDDYIARAYQSDPAGGRPPETPFYIGSVTKTFVGAVALQIVSEGRLTLDTTLATQVPWPNGDQITVRMLLSHTSGVPEWNNGADEARGQKRILDDLSRIWTIDEQLAELRTYQPSDRPGGRYRYSNGNFLLLTAMVTAITGNPMEDEIQRRIIEPLGLRSTYAALPDTLTRAGLEMFHDVTGSGQPVNLSNIDRHSTLTLFANGGMVSSPADLTRWAHALWGSGPVLDDASRRALVPAPGAQYGLATERACPCADDQPPSGVGHSGSIPGSVCRVVYYAADDLAIVLQADTTPQRGRVLEEATEQILGLVAK